MQEAGRHPGFVLETSIDPKALDNANTGADATKSLIRELKYVAKIETDLGGGNKMVEAPTTDTCERWCAHIVAAVVASLGAP